MRSAGSFGKWFVAVALGVLAGSAAIPVPGLGQSLNHDKAKPIEISADSLEVAQEQQIATFQGNVDAVQGDLVLSAETLKVHYAGKNSTAGLAAGTGGAINRIVASGDVILSSPDETAEGDTGIYNVATQLITLTGDVVLTRGDNVLRGERLELDLTTGKSRMVGTTGAEGAEDVALSSGRVKALFTPKPRKKAEPKKVEAIEAPVPREPVDQESASRPPLPLAKPR